MRINQFVFASTPRTNTDQVGPSAVSSGAATPVRQDIDRVEKPAPAATGAAASPALTPHEALTEAVEEGDLLELLAQLGPLTPEEASKLLNQVDIYGNTALLHAVKNKQPVAAAFLASRGADVGVSDRKGRNVVFAGAAAGDHRAVRVFVERHRAELVDGVRFYPEDILAAIDARAKKPVEAVKLDRWAARLTGTASKSFSLGVSLQKYMTHFEGLKENQFGVDPEGWNFEAFLANRVRSLLEVALKPDSVLGENSAATKPDEVKNLRKVLSREIATILESLRIRNRNLAMAKLSSPALRRELANIEAESIVERALDSKTDFEISIPGGWAGHAIYLNLSRRQVAGREVLTLRMDNLGSGLTFHENEDKTWVYPWVCNVPVDAVDGDTKKDLVGIVATQLLVKIAAKSQANKTVLYDALETFRGKMVLDHEEIVFLDGPKTFPKRGKQVAGNCVVENQLAGFRQRHGDAAEPILAAEGTLVFARMMAALNPKLWQAQVDANRTRKDKIFASNDDGS